MDIILQVSIVRVVCVPLVSCRDEIMAVPARGAVQYRIALFVLR